jgi:hypothetical protein
LERLRKGVSDELCAVEAGFVRGLLIQPGSVLSRLTVRL